MKDLATLTASIRTTIQLSGNSCVIMKHITDLHTGKIAERSNLFIFSLLLGLIFSEFKCTFVSATTSKSYSHQTVSMIWGNQVIYGRHLLTGTELTCLSLFTLNAMERHVVFKCHQCI